MFLAEPTIHDQVVLSGRSLALALASLAIGALLIEVAKSAPQVNRRARTFLAVYQALLAVDVFVTLARPWSYCVPFWLVGAAVPNQILDVKSGGVPWFSGAALVIVVALLQRELRREPSSTLGAGAV